MKPPFSSMALRGRGDDEGGELMSWFELGNDGDGMDVPDSLMNLQQPQETKKVDADFFNNFEDDFDEEDMNPTKGGCTPAISSLTSFLWMASRHDGIYPGISLCR